MDIFEYLYDIINEIINFIYKFFRLDDNLKPYNGYLHNYVKRQTYGYPGYFNSNGFNSHRVTYPVQMCFKLKPNPNNIENEYKIYRSILYKYALESVFQTDYSMFGIKYYLLVGFHDDEDMNSFVAEMRSNGFYIKYLEDNDKLFRKIYLNI